MLTSFLPYEPDQDFLLPPSPAEWLPENHLAYFVSEIVDRLDLQRFYARYEGNGRRNQPFDPAMKSCLWSFKNARDGRAAGQQRRSSAVSAAKSDRRTRCLVGFKHIIGFRQFSLRGLSKVTGEWSLVCVALNVRRMWALQT
jgi:hypothetical protein